MTWSPDWASSQLPFLSWLQRSKSFLKWSFPKWAYNPRYLWWRQSSKTGKLHNTSNLTSLVIYQIPSSFSFIVVSSSTPPSIPANLLFKNLNAGLHIHPHYILPCWSDTQTKGNLLDTWLNHINTDCPSQLYEKEKNQLYAVFLNMLSFSLPKTSVILSKSTSVK